MPFLAMALNSSVGKSGNLGGPGIQLFVLLQSPSMSSVNRLRRFTPFSVDDFRPLALEEWNS